MQSLEDSEPCCSNFSKQDAGGKAIGVSACDVDGDGHEEVFILNTDAYSGPTTKTSVRLFNYDRSSRKFTDLFTLERNQKARAFAAGRSVACLDRDQDGRYGRVGAWPCARGWLIGWEDKQCYRTYATPEVSGL